MEVELDDSAEPDKEKENEAEEEDGKSEKKPGGS